jgi:hypothetical protein
MTRFLLSWQKVDNGIDLGALDWKEDYIEEIGGERIRI